MYSKTFQCLILVLILLSFTTAYSQTPEDKNRKKVIAVADFTNHGVNENVVSNLNSYMQTVVYRTGLWTLANRAELKKMMDEYAVQQSGVCDETKCFADIGMAVGADYLLVGSVGKLGQTYQVSVKLVNVETVTDDFIESELCKGCPADDLPQIVETLVQKMVAQFTSDEKAQEIVIPPSQQEESKGFLDIDISNPGATLKINEKVYEPGKIELPPGIHNIEVSQNGYQTVTETVEISPGETIEKSYTLTRKSGFLDISLSSPEATLAINNKQYEPGKIELPPGIYKVKVTRPKYQTVTETINLSPDQTIQKTYELTKNTGFLNLEVSPADATILLNGNKDYTNQNRIELLAGEYKIELKKEGYKPKTDIVSIKAEQNLTKTYTLQHKTGALQFAIQPSETNVIMKRDGKTYKSWEGNKQLNDIPVGTYQLEMTYEDYLTKKRTIHLTEDQTIEIDENLESVDEIRASISSAKRNKYLWLLGSVVCAGVGGYYKYSADSDYDDYKTATDRATDLHETVENKDKISLISFGAAGACLVPTMIYQIKQSRLNNKLELSLKPEKDGASFAVKVRW
jgi:TolB-like protein